MTDCLGNYKTLVNCEGKSIRMAGMEKESFVDGPGIRMVIFTQGCTRHCPGCHNPETHDKSGGKIVTVKDIISGMDENPIIDGITISGGEPFYWTDEIIPILYAAKKRNMNTVVFTGYIFEELLKLSKQDGNNIYTALTLIDILVDGPFILAKRDIGLMYRGSSNQRIIDVPCSLDNGTPVIHSIQVKEQLQKGN